MYNATCPCFREVVFGNTQDKTVDLAIKHTKIVRQLTEEATAKYGTIFKYEYSPETFTQTEPDFAIRVCEAVKSTWGKAGLGDERIIFNLPSTVEIGPPNHYADLVRRFSCISYFIADFIADRKLLSQNHRTRENSRQSPHSQ
jgi:2-isopropylmalate synthase